MSNGKKILGLVGSPRPDGLTNRLVAGALKGAADAGAGTELVQMSEYVVNACKDCLPWVCMQNKKCNYNDTNLEFISAKLLECDGIVLGTPVYWGDTTAMVRLMMLKLFRIYAMPQAFHGIPAFGIAIAGGSGNGLVSGLKPLYHFFRVMWMRGIEPLPVTRFNFEDALKNAEKSGSLLAKMEKKRFKTRDERDLLYDNLPYLNETNEEERRLLAAMAYKALPADKKIETEGSWAQADIELLGGHPLKSMAEITRIYDSAFNEFEGK